MPLRTFSLIVTGRTCEGFTQKAVSHAKWSMTKPSGTGPFTCSQIQRCAGAFLPSTRNTPCPFGARAPVQTQHPADFSTFAKNRSMGDISRSGRDDSVRPVRRHREKCLGQSPFERLFRSQVSTLHFAMPRFYHG